MNLWMLWFQIMSKKMKSIGEIEKELAIEAATSDLEFNCDSYLCGASGIQWHRLDTDWTFAGDDQQVSRAVRYLESEGMLIKHDQDSSLVTVKKKTNSNF